MNFNVLVYCIVAICIYHYAGDSVLSGICLLIANLHYIADQIIKALPKEHKERICKGKG